MILAHYFIRMGSVVWFASVSLCFYSFFCVYYFSEEYLSPQSTSSLYPPTASLYSNRNRKFFALHCKHLLNSSPQSQFANCVNTAAGGSKLTFSNLLLMHARECCIKTSPHILEKQVFQSEPLYIMNTASHQMLSLHPQLVSVWLRAVCSALCWWPPALYHWAGEHCCFHLRTPSTSEWWWHCKWVLDMWQHSFIII